MADLPALRILLTEDNRATRQALTSYMTGGGHEVISTDNAEDALVLFEQERPDIVVLDVMLPGKDGYWAAREMRKSEAGRWTPIVFVTSRGEEDDLMMGIEAGADDYLVKPVSRTVLLAKLRAVERIRLMREQLVRVSNDLRAMNAQLENLASTDALTGLANRRAFDDRLATEVARARRDGTPLTLMMIDIDHFKRYNDCFGHPAGDVCLQKVARLLADTCRRPADLAARYGGEEFALILPNTSKSGAMALALMLQTQLQRLQIEHPDAHANANANADGNTDGDGGGAYVTISGGTTTCTPERDTHPAGMIMRADQALYVAKKKGRARFFSYEMQLDTAAGPVAGSAAVAGSGLGQPLAATEARSVPIALLSPTLADRAATATA